MKLKSFKIINKDKFRKGITISFEINKKRTDNLGFLFHNTNISKWTIALGKNSTGKSSIYRIILSYFMAFDMYHSFFNTQNNIGNLNINNDIQNNFLLNVEEEHSQMLIDILKPQKNKKVYNEYLMEPRYEVTYITKKNVEIKHIVSINKSNSQMPTTFYQSVFSSKNGSPIFVEESTKLSTNVTSNNYKPTQNHHFNKNHLEELFSFIKTTSRISFDSDIDWRTIIDKTLSKYNSDLSDRKKEFFKFLTSILKSADPNFQEFHFQNGIQFKVNIGEKTKLITIKELSTGTRHIIYLAIKIFEVASSRFGGLFIHDELDAHINKQLAWKMITKTLDFKKFQGFATSHSPNIFDNQFRYDSLYEISNDNGAIIVNTFANKYKLRSDKKVSNFFELNITTTPEDFE